MPFLSKFKTVLINSVNLICDSLALNASKGNIHTVHNSSPLKDDHNNCNPNHNETVHTSAGEMFQILNTIRSGNIDNIVIGLLNVNSFCNKHDAMKLMIPGEIDMIIVETKLNHSSPSHNLLVMGMQTLYM